MTERMKTIIYRVTDLVKAKIHVGYQVEGQDVGLDPHGHSKGMTGPVSYWHVDDIEASMTALLAAGAQPQQEVNDVGGGKLVATVKDADGNIIGLIQA
jgi:Predicted enzyme related to lactoylglutathione lyase